MTDDERAAIERAVQRCCKACEDWRGDSHPPDEDVLADIIAAELSPLLAAKDERIAEAAHERDDLSRKLAVAEGELTIARQEWDNLYAKFIKVATKRDEYAAGLKLAQQKLAESTSERETLETQLAAAKERVKRAERIASMDSSRLVDERIRRIAELERQVAEAKQAHSCANNSPIPSSGPADEGWMEKAWLSFYVSAGWVEKDRFLAALRAHAPAARYPEVVEFLDAVGGGPWSMAAGCCEGKASYYVQSVNIDNGTWFARDTLAAACRAALDSRKELSDVD